MRIAVLTGGGDCPGLNAAIRAIVKRGTTQHGHSIIGFRDGWKGFLDGDSIPLDRNDVRGTLVQGGTMLGTARCHPHQEPGGLERVQEIVESERIDAVICIGGDGTLDAAAKVGETGVPIIGIPKTIDNDVAGTDVSIGFDTALMIATEAIDRLHSTAESHNRVMVVEVMGRHCGWIAVCAGIASGADIILAPEEPFDIDKVSKSIQRRHHRQQGFSIVTVAEGAAPAKGTSWDSEGTQDSKGNPIAGEMGAHVTRAIQARTGFETRLTVLGYVQRGGTPTPRDRLIATRMGVAAIDAASEGVSHKFTALRGEKIKMIDLKEAAGKTKRVPKDILDAVRGL
jgi:ATP-dependent phosphofructokinase / diphosphate-dependent phosphofructokinase